MFNAALVSSEPGTGRIHWMLVADEPKFRFPSDLKIETAGKVLCPNDPEVQKTKELEVKKVEVVGRGANSIVIALSPEFDPLHRAELEDAIRVACRHSLAV